MKEVFVSYPVNYVIGHLRYGHKEGSIIFTDEQFEDFQKDPEHYLKYSGTGDCLDLIVDDYRVEDYDHDIDNVEWREVN